MLSTDQFASNRPYGTVADPGRVAGAGKGPLPSGNTADTSEKASEIKKLSLFLESGADRPPIADVLRWADQLLDQLHHQHILSPPVIHGGITPANIRLDAASNAELIGSTAASTTDQDVSYRPLEQIWEGLNDISRRVILDRSDADTEKWLLEPLSGASDIYSVGAILYAVATGVVPNDALDRSIAAIEDKPDPLRSPAELDPAIPLEISDVIMKAMSLRRDDRFYSTVIFRQILRTAAVKVREREAEEIPQRRHSDQPAAIATSDIQTVDHNREWARELATRILAEKAATPEVLKTQDAEVEANILEMPAVNAVVIEMPQQTVGFAATEVLSANTEAEVTKTRPRWLLPAVGLAAVIFLSAIGGGLYKFAGSDQTAMEPVTVPATMVAQPVSETVQQPETVSVSDTSIVSDTPIPFASPEKPTRATLAAQPDKQKKPQAQPAKPTPKKALTVDDLINDH